MSRLLNEYTTKYILFIFAHNLIVQSLPEWMITFGQQTYGYVLNDIDIQ